MYNNPGPPEITGFKGKQIIVNGQNINHFWNYRRLKNIFKMNP
jgi:hypothetical protein